MPYKLVVPPGYRRHGGAAPRSTEGVPHTTRAQRMRFLEILRLSCDDTPPRTPGPEARRRIVEVLRLQAGLPATPSDSPYLRGRPETIDLSQFDEDIAWMKARFHRREKLFADSGLYEDSKGRVTCLACQEPLAASPWGLPTALHPRAMAYAHAFTCPRRRG